MMTQGAAEFAYVHYKQFHEAATDLITTYLSLFGVDEREYVEGFEIENDTIEINTEYPACRRGCCGSEWSSYSIPVSYLWEKDWIEQEKTKRELVKQEKLRKEAEVKKEQEAKRIAARKAQYEQLKGEFENVE